MTTAKRPILAILHTSGGDPGVVASSLEARGYIVERVRICDAPLPEDVSRYAGVVSFGGPMSANDESLGFIADELRWLPRVLKTGTPFLGVCLGAQMMARVLGAQVAPHPRHLLEAGYYPIEATQEGRSFLAGGPMQVYHWHQEGFVLPRGATLLATGEDFSNQAYRYGDRVYGVQFHPEITRAIMSHWIEVAGHKLNRPTAQPGFLHLGLHAQHKAAVRRWLERFWDGWLGEDR